MYKLYIALLTALFSTQVIYAQHPLTKVWDKRYGGFVEDELSLIIQSKDGGYVLAGNSYSAADGDKTQPNWDTTLSSTDYWIFKIDSLGNKQWDKRFGGFSFDGLFSIQQTLDGGYILGGFSDSDTGGDKTQPGRGGADYWIVKIDSLGNKQWDKRFGGTNNDYLSALQITRDGGYILCGSSNSPISGDKTQDDWDTTYQSDDGWVVKIDSAGNKQWDRRYGGVYEDYFNAVQQTSDGGYLLGGSSGGGITGDVTQPACDSTLDVHFWIVKIDSAGNQLWDKRFCLGDNLACLELTKDGGYVLGGPECLIIKTDSLGNEEWNKIFDAGLYYFFSTLLQTFDGGYLAGGTSGYQYAQGDKSENNLGPEQTWIVKTDSFGNKQWDKTIFTYDNNYGYAIQARDGNYVIGTQCDGGIGGYKTQPNWDTTDNTNDYWVVKMKDTLLNGIDSVSTGSSVQVYPNPFNSDISISIQAVNIQNATFTISNVLGETVFYKQESNLSNHYTKMLDLSYLANGVYLLEVVVDEERVVQKIVKQ